ERLMRACQSVCEHIVALSDIPAVLTMSLSAAEVIDWVMHSLSGELVPRPSKAGSIPIIGWLDLTLDDAPHLILTGVHDGVVPECVNADPFLPNQLRRQLGMIDNARRYARDMYAFKVLLQSRRHVRVIVGRTNLSGDPLVPSRLLLACDLAELPARVLRLTSEEGIDVLPEVRKRWQAADGEKLGLAVPPPDSARKPPYLTVTAFRTYLACPYRFYLNHVLKLRAIDDVDAELSAGQFGDLIHETLRRMHDDPVIGKSADAAAIEAFLRETVEHVAAEKYGPHPAAAIRVQIAQAQDRLATFAAKQAEHVAAGWQTRHYEVDAELEIGELFAGQPLPIRLLGRIDRIDYHPATGRWAVWDYKTSDGGTRPVQNHFNSKSGWTDLQLPLYRHLVRALKIDSEPTVGYILLPKSHREVSFVPAEFTRGQLADADSEALRVMQSVAAGIYQPRTLTAIAFDDFARICQVGTQQSSPPRPPRRPDNHHRAAAAHRLANQRVVEAAERRLADPDDLALRGSVAPPLMPLMIRASAGTGKTYQLSNRLLQIILSGQSVDHVLATTFTRKAAGEILQRVLVRLARACVDDAQFAELKKAISQLPFEQADCLAALRRVTRQLHRFRVSTLDSFYAQLARTFSLELRLAPGWSAVDPVREEAIRMQAIQHMLDQSEQRTLTSLVKMLSKGETKRSVAREIQETVEGGYHFYRAAGAKAFNELKVPKSPPEEEFHQALEFLRRFDPGHKSIRNAQATMADLASAGDWEGVVGQSLMKSAVATGRFYNRELDPKLLDQLAVLRRKCAAEILPVRRAQAEAAYELLDSFNGQYMALLRRQRMLAFADITYLLSRWMNQTSASGLAPNDQALIPIDQQQLMLRMDCGIDHLLLDEFQDTAPDQWHIIEPLARPLTQTITPSQSFFCVGDTKQAIYGWRGGVAEIFDTVTRSVANLSEEELRESYRSSPQVVDAVNDVFQHLTRHENFADCNEVADQWCRKFPEHKTTRSDLPGYVLVKNGIACDPALSSEDRETAEL
ncbi:MAG: UvrD-helicase domain-containing protein, partial [Aureliella sp.]